VGVTFNVVFMPGSVRRLLPFGLSLLRGSGVRVRLVANCCAAEEVELLREAEAADPRVVHHVLPSGRPIEHGIALNHLFATFPLEPEFAIADSDVIASGDFMPSLLPSEPHPAAVFAAPPAWSVDSDTAVDPGTEFLSGRKRHLSDNPSIGNSYFAVYRRAAVEPLLRTLPRGFGVHQWRMLPDRLRASYAARGWRFRMFDTCRLVNLELFRAGERLENRSTPDLHHVGGLSSEPIRGMRPLVRGFAAMLRSRDDVPARMANAIFWRMNRRRRLRDPQFVRMDARRAAVRSHVRSVLEALAAGEPIPPAPRTDSPEVDRRLAALVAAIEANYQPLGRAA
jgi:hypothetical protein